jgi:transposase InsO family protein
LSLQSKTRDWLDALGKAVNQQFPQGVREKEQLFLVSDNGSQPTSVGFMAACNVLAIKQIFASYDNPKGNADTERVIRTIKEDLVWPNDFATPFELQAALDKWVMNYNTDYPHSSLSYKTPCEFERLCLEKLPNFLVA